MLAPTAESWDIVCRSWESDMLVNVFWKGVPLPFDMLFGIGECFLWRERESFFVYIFNKRRRRVTR